MMPILEIRDLLVTRNGNSILTVPELRVHEGEILSLIGPNGAGKTTLLLSILSLVKRDSGDIFYKNEVVNAGPGLLGFRRKAAMVFQEPLLFSTDVFGNIASGLKFRGLGKKQVREAVSRSMELFGIAGLSKRASAGLSAGEAQRVNLARAFAVNPEILLLDEPFASLDAPTRDTLIQEIESIIRGTGVTAIFATHDRMEAMRLSDRIIVMKSGAVVQTGTPHQVFQNPADEFVASFMGTETILSGKVRKTGNGIFAVAVDGKKIEISGAAEMDSAVTFCIAPEHIVLSKRAGSAMSARNSFSGKVTRIVSMGFFYKVYIDCGFTLVSFVTGESVKKLSIREGRSFTASFKATSVHVIKKARA